MSCIAKMVWRARQYYMFNAVTSGQHSCSRYLYFRVSLMLAFVRVSRLLIQNLNMTRSVLSPKSWILVLSAVENFEFMSWCFIRYLSRISSHKGNIVITVFNYFSHFWLFVFGINFSFSILLLRISVLHVQGQRRLCTPRGKGFIVLRMRLSVVW